MKRTEVIIKNKLGLHARASAKFVSAASRFQSNIDLIKDSAVVNGKSIMGVMTLGAKQGTKLVLEIDGPDEEQMEEAMIKLIENRFGEAE